MVFPAPLRNLSSLASLEGSSIHSSHPVKRRVVLVWRRLPVSFRTRRTWKVEGEHDGDCIPASRTDYGDGQALTGHCLRSCAPTASVCTRVESVSDEGEARNTHEGCTDSDDALVGDVSDVGDVPRVELEVYRLTGYVPCRGIHAAMSVPSTMRGGKAHGTDSAS